MNKIWNWTGGDLFLSKECILTENSNVKVLKTSWCTVDLKNTFGVFVKRWSKFMVTFEISPLKGKRKPASYLNLTDNITLYLFIMQHLPRKSHVCLSPNKFIKHNRHDFPLQI